MVAVCESTQQKVLLGESSKLIASSQSASYGRESRQWSSPPGGLWMSWREQLPRIEGLTLAVSLAVARTVLEFGVGCWLRWPNDVMVGSRKLAGCLVDARLNQNLWSAVIGLGLNVKTDFSQSDPEISQLATSLEREGLIELDLALVARSFEKSWYQIKAILDVQGFSGLLQECQRLMFGGHQALLSIELDGGLLQKRFAGLAPDGALILDGGQKLYSCTRLTVIDDTTNWGRLS